MILITPGMILKPTSEDAIIKCLHRVLHVQQYLYDDEERKVILMIEVEPHRSADRLYFTGYKPFDFDDIQKQLDRKRSAAPPVRGGVIWVTWPSAAAAANRCCC